LSAAPSPGLCVRRSAIGLLVLIPLTICRTAAQQPHSGGPNAESRRAEGIVLGTLPDPPLDSTVRQREVLHASGFKPTSLWTLPTPIRDVEPVYPNQARAAGIEGTAMVDMHVAENGTVDSFSVYKSSGSPLLDDAAADAAVRCTFTPALDLQHRPIAIWVRRPFRFHLGPVYYYDELVTGTSVAKPVMTFPCPLGYDSPEYPERSRRTGEEGTVILGIWLRKDGTAAVGQLYESSGHPLLDTAAIRASFNSTFTPALDSAGDATSTWVARTVNFSLKRNQ